MTTYRTGLSAAALRLALYYDTETGEFRWKDRAHWERKHRTRWLGKVAGSPTHPRNNARSYWAIRIDGALYLAHRLAWLYVNGEWPERDLDHINGNSLDNSIGNLRLCDAAENQWNRTSGAERDSQSGIRGVQQRGGSFRVRVNVRGKTVTRSFRNIETATSWQREMAKLLHGDFAA